MLPVPDRAFLAEFTGRDVSTYGAFADQALIQATVLFSTLTGLEEYPTDYARKTLVINAILELADRIYLEQPYAATQATPFSSETIASYSYTKAQRAVKSGESSGLRWWDLAISEFAVASTITGSGSVRAFETDIATDAEGVRYLPPPVDNRSGFFLGQ